MLLQVKGVRTVRFTLRTKSPAGRRSLHNCKTLSYYVTRRTRLLLLLLLLRVMSSPRFSSSPLLLLVTFAETTMTPFDNNNTERNYTLQYVQVFSSLPLPPIHRSNILQTHRPCDETPMKNTTTTYIRRCRLIERHL